MSNGIEILIAEDSPTQAEQLKKLLEESGYRVTVAANGKKALAEAKKRKPTLIITDIVMPVMDGYAFCNEVKSDETLKDTPVVLLTGLSSPQDVINGLECNADNFIRKPYDERYLLSRIKQILTNRELRNSQRMQPGVMIYLAGQKHFITSERQQILDLLISTYEQAVHINKELGIREQELAHSNDWLKGLYLIAKGLNQSASEQQVVEEVLGRAMNMPGIQAGWIVLREGESDFRMAAARGLPPALEVPGAMEGDCLCRRKLLSGELRQTINVFECERLKKAKGDEHGIRIHASIPLWIGDRTLGILNLGGAEESLTRGDTMKIMNGVGNQIGIALERARLHEHLERRVEERTAALTAEVAERKQAEEAQARLVAILEATTDFIGIADAHEHALYLNAGARKMLGIGEDEDIAAFPIADSHPEWARKLVLGEGIPAAIRDGVWSGETALLSRDDREIPVSQVILAHKAPDGTVEFLSTIARDITERKRFEAQLEATVEARTRELQAANLQLEAASRHKSEFLANMSHELRTPLNSILGFSQLLHDQTFGALTEKQARYVDHVHQSGKHLLALINDLLDLSKVEAGKLELRPEALDVREALTAALTEIHPQSEAKGLTLHLDMTSGLPPLVADPVRFKQILYNLLS
ncbi:MAG TPA: response regulator, partial [Candidatus Methylomirabilis sp.]|nr:response regulator [Candidatus Methylomirabilis sp.]